MKTYIKYQNFGYTGEIYNCLNMCNFILKIDYI